MRIGVVGGGAWGTALAQVAAAAGEEVLLWAREQDVVAAINSARENTTFLPGVALGEAITATADLKRLEACEALLVVTPAQHMRAVLGGLPGGPRPLVLCSKGIEEASGLMMHDVAREAAPGAPVAVLSGPTFAHEVAAGLPTAVTLATDDELLGQRLAQRLARPSFRPYLSSDVIGAEVGGAVKNVLAIACGVVDGMGLGLNARAALISRGFAEMIRFGLARGARAETMAGLAGLGDLVLTCSSENSRNFSLGKGIGAGARAVDLLADRRTVAEGASTAPVLKRVAWAVGVEMPIVDAVCALLDGSASAGEVVERLMARPLRVEGAKPLLYLVIKAALSGLIVAVTSEVARRAPGWGGLIVSLPMVSLLSFIWLWRDTGHPERIAALSTGAFWFFLPSMPLFLLLPLMLRAGIGFWGSLETACLVTIALYAFMAWLGPRLGLLL